MLTAPHVTRTAMTMAAVRSGMPPPSAHALTVRWCGGHRHVTPAPALHRCRLDGAPELLVRPVMVLRPRAMTHRPASAVIAVPVQRPLPRQCTESGLQVGATAVVDRHDPDGPVHPSPHHDLGGLRRTVLVPVDRAAVAPDRPPTQGPGVPLAVFGQVVGSARM